jgi:hypothetical protein
VADHLQARRKVQQECLQQLVCENHSSLLAVVQEVLGFIGGLANELEVPPGEVKVRHKRDSILESSPGVEHPLPLPV